jgi:glycosyltransferase involved in cell wall biosynthesis
MRLGRAEIRGRQVIGYWSWELPIVSPDWHAGVPFVHEIWVPSAFTAAALEPLLPGRVRIVRPPLTEAPPVPARLGRADFGLPDDAVIVTVAFNLASSFERKNPIAAVRAFRAAFGDRHDRLLLMKVGNPDHFPADFQQLKSAIAGLSNVRIETRVFPPADHFALLATSDIVLSLHRSEGLGLVPAEAMLLRKPVVATGWSGNMDFMDQDSAALVPFRMIPPHDPRGVLQAEGALWADPEINAAAALLQRLAEDSAARIGLGERGYRMAVSRFGLGSLAEALRGIGQQVNEGG